MSTSTEAAGIPRLQRSKPPPIDLSVVPSGAGSTPQRIQLWPASQQRVAPEAPEAGPGSPTPAHEGGLSPGIALSPLVGGQVESGWAGGIPVHILELIFAALRDSQGRWPSRKVLFSVCGVCKLWRRVGHTLFFSNMWHPSHSDVIVHPSQLFTLSPHPLRLPSSDHLLRCFVHRTPCPASGLSPRFGRLCRFDLYLGSDHRSLLRTSGLGAEPGGSPGLGPSSSSSNSSGGGGAGAGGGGGGLGLASGSSSSAGPQLLMLAQQTGRRTYQLMLSPATGPGPGRGSVGCGGAAAAVGWRSPRPDLACGSGGVAGGGDSGGGGGDGGWRTPQAPRAGAAVAASGGGGGRGSGDSGVVAVLRSNIRCSHYELLPKSSCPWARRLISVAGYLAPQGSPQQPLIQLEYRLRVRGIMLPRRMKVQVPVPHSLQRVVHNPLYDLHEPVAGGPSPAAAGWPGAFGAAGAGAAGGMAPPAPGAAGAAVAAGAAAANPIAPFGGAGGGGGGGGFNGEGNEGLMDNLEDILEAAMRTEEPLLFANMVDAAVVVRPADDDEAGAAAAAAGRAPSAAAGLRRVRSSGRGLLGKSLRGFLSNRLPAAGGGGGDGQPAGGTVQWSGPGSPGSSRGGGGAAAAGAGAEGAAAAGGGGGGWAASSPAAPARMVRLQNKAPHWNDALMCWCLNFRGRVKMASVKNFQLMATADGAGRCVMQFGKVEEGLYILDFNPCVLTAAQAFAAALSTFETKYLL
ncbi:hypothetical protein PLESTB_001126600 [Pleodorina starrii]|uniref:Tubby C-terminal domain-containing protein n=1 Tax=Pleodorina starrii TaxID=330485 RepID=A0A9W6F5P4_9CHLO|nr:hypothetical protein PLESTM_001364200 [Pleodorina starrii]GLC56611.1 hypothetical protein PLESTB_001126600 [Pleodorina starrii]GLC76199.1 hypothetical protein PLESTF_001748800 [Pleodorina starrii]